MYARKVGDREIHLRVSGMLWNRSLVMEDEETGSLWSHILGRCMEGKLKGQELELIPAVMTTWEEWRRNHPLTTVLKLSRSASDYKRDFYSRLDRFVLGVVVAGAPRAYPFDVLNQKGLVEDQVGGVPVLVHFDPKSTRASIFSRRLGDRLLSFRVEAGSGVLIDKNTGSRWSPHDGTAIEGPLKGRRLKNLGGIVSYRRAWEVFHPDSGFFGAPKKRRLRL